MYLRRLLCMAVCIRDTRQAVCVRVFIKLCLHSLLSRQRPGKGAAVQGGGVRVRWEVKGEWDEVRDACSRGCTDVGVDVDMNVDVDVVERRRRPLTWLGSHRPGLDCAVQPWNRTYFVPVGASMSSQICHHLRGSRAEKRGKCDRSWWENHVLHRPDGRKE